MTDAHKLYDAEHVISMYIVNGVVIAWQDSFFFIFASAFLSYSPHEFYDLSGPINVLAA